MKVRIYYHDTDCGGVVYYANYLKYMEQARTEYLEERGMSVKKLMDQGTMFVVYHQEVDYKYPAFYNDTLEVITTVTGVSEVKTEFEYRIKNQDGRLTTRGKTTLVSVDTKTLEAKPISEELKKIIMGPAISPTA